MLFADGGGRGLAKENEKGEGARGHFRYFSSQTHTSGLANGREFKHNTDGMT